MKNFLSSPQYHPWTPSCAPLEESPGSLFTLPPAAQPNVMLPLSHLELECSYKAAAPKRRAVCGCTHQLIPDTPFTSPHQTEETGLRWKVMVFICVGRWISFWCCPLLRERERDPVIVMAALCYSLELVMVLQRGGSCALEFGLSAQTWILIPALPLNGTWKSHNLSEPPILNVGHLNINTYLVADGRG